MIAEFSIENFFSIKSSQKISFESTSDVFMSDEYSYEVKEGVRLLKIGIIYGANASGKTCNAGFPASRRGGSCHR